MEETVHTFLGLDNSQWQIAGIIIGAIFTLIGTIITMRKFKSSRPSITIKQISQANWEVDRKSQSDPDIFWQYPYRLIFTVNIVNLSNNPISIYDWVIKSRKLFSRSLIFESSTAEFLGKSYKCSYSGGVVSKGAVKYNTDLKSESINFNNKNLLFTEIIDLQPYQAITGSFVFLYDEPLSRKVKLILSTSRKKIKTKIKIEPLVETVNNQFIPTEKHLKLRKEVESKYS